MNHLKLFEEFNFRFGEKNVPENEIHSSILEAMQITQKDVDFILSNKNGYHAETSYSGDSYNLNIYNIDNFIMIFIQYFIEEDYYTVGYRDGASDEFIKMKFEKVDKCIDWIKNMIKYRNK
jgi:hypothetical protein